MAAALAPAARTRLRHNQTRRSRRNISDHTVIKVGADFDAGCCVMLIARSLTARAARAKSISNLPAVGQYKTMHYYSISATRTEDPACCCVRR